jgi:hypothetical protein
MPQQQQQQQQHQQPIAQLPTTPQGYIPMPNQMPVPAPYHSLPSSSSAPRTAIYASQLSNYTICRNVWEWFNKVSECEHAFLRYCRTNSIPVNQSADYGGQKDYFVTFLQSQSWTLGDYVQAKKASKVASEMKHILEVKEVLDNPKAYTPLHILKIFAKYNRPL